MKSSTTSGSRKKNSVHFFPFSYLIRVCYCLEMKLVCCALVWDTTNVPGRKLSCESPVVGRSAIEAKQALSEAAHGIRIGMKVMISMLNSVKTLDLQ